MGHLEAARRWLERLLTQPGQELGRWTRLLRFQIHLGRFCAQRLWENNVGAMSAALSFRTIFTLIPMLVLTFLVLKSAGVLEDGKRSLRTFLDASGFTQITMVQPDNQEAQGSTAPSASEAEPAETLPRATVPQDEHGTPTDGPAPSQDRVINVADEIENLVTQVESRLTFDKLGPIGVGLLIWTALSLLTAVESSLNRIFGAVRGRPWPRRLILYWSAMTLLPILLTVAGYASNRAVQALHETAGLTWVLALLGRVGMMAWGVVIVAGVYKMLPNTRVGFRAALTGAFVAVPIWLLAKWGFSLYVRRFVATGNLYGTLGVLPLFLIWLNVSWLIFLFGAELAHTAVNVAKFEALERARKLRLGPLDHLAAALVVADAHLSGRGPVCLETIAGRLGLPEASTAMLLQRLEADAILCPVETGKDEAYVPARAAQAIPVLAALGVSAVPGGEQPRHYAPELGAAIDAVRQTAENELGRLTLADAVQGRTAPQTKGSHS